MIPTDCLEKGRCGVTTVWKNAYEDRWAGVLTDESHAHPAKFAKGLIERIVDYLLASGALQAGDLVVDPFGGIASGGIVCAYRGLNWLGVELEPRFVDLGQGNIRLHADKVSRECFVSSIS